MTPASARILMRHANRIAARTDMAGHDPATLALDTAEAICGKLTETRLTYVIRSEPELVGYALIRLTADGTAPRELYGYLEDLPGPLLESVALRLLHTWTDTCRTIAETVLRTVEGTDPRAALGWSDETSPKTAAEEPPATNPADARPARTEETP